MCYFKHPTAEVQTKKIGDNTKIWQYSVILENASIGNNCNVNFNCFIENNVIIGNNVTLKCGVYLWDGITIEDDVFIGSNVTFINDIHPRSKNYKPAVPILIKKGASIGANSTIMGGLTIGSYSMIGAGSLLTKSIPDYNLWYGSPAKFKGYVCACGNKLNNDLMCISCNKKYFIKNDKVNVL